jgi:hypothetical protein
VWNSTLDRLEGDAASQAGEIEPGLEDGEGGGDKGMDADTGSGGYSGDAVEAGHDAALAEPDRPLNEEIHGDPRTATGDEFPDDAKRANDDQRPIGETDLEEDREES